MMKKGMKKKAMAGILAAIMALSMSSAVYAEDAAEAETEAAAAEAEAGTEAAETAAAGERGHLNVALYWFGDDMDPANGWCGWTLTRAAVGETLVTVNEDMEMVGQLADSWEAVDDTTWKFHIRQGVTFQNGNPVTAEAVMSSIQRSLDLNERGETNLKLESMETDGEYIIFHTKEPYGAFLGNLSEPLFVIVDTTADTTTFWETPVCTGPYMVTSYEDDISFEAVAYDGYWGGTPACESITVYNISDDNTRAMALQSGDIDLAQGIAASEISLFEGNDDYEVQSATGTRVDLLFMNTAREPLSDQNIRLAFNAAINYEAMAATIGGGTVASGSPFPPSTPYGYDELTKATYDPEACAAYLEAAGYTDTDGDGYVDKDGEILELNLCGSSGAGGSGQDTTMSEIVQAQAKACGIKVNIQLVENLEDVKTSGEFDLMFGNWQTASTGDPQWFLDQVFKTGATDNYGQYSDEALDAIIDQLSVTFDTDERAELTKEASQIIIDDGFGCYLVSGANINVCSKNVSNMHTFPIDYYLLTYDTAISE